MAGKTPKTESTEPTTQEPSGSSAPVAPNPLGEATATGAPNATAPVTGDTDSKLGLGAEFGNEEKSLEPVLGEQAATPAVATPGSRAREALGNMGAAPAPTMVNGVSVVGKKLNDAGTEYIDDPDYVATSGARAEDIFDRIGNAFPMEAQRLIIEELAHLIGATADNTQDLPETMPAHGKSTASLRTDVTGFGAYAGGKGVTGAIPVAPGTDGTAQVTE